MMHVHLGWGTGRDHTLVPCALDATLVLRLTKWDVWKDHRVGNPNPDPNQHRRIRDAGGGQLFFNVFFQPKPGWGRRVVNLKKMYMVNKCSSPKCLFHFEITIYNKVKVCFPFLFLLTRQ